MPTTLHHPWEVDAYVATRAATEQPLWKAAREVIKQCVPECDEMMKWEIPFYLYRGLMCYLNPRKDGTLELGFSRGAELQTLTGTTLPLLGKGSTVRRLPVRTPADLEPEAVLELIRAAGELNRTQMRTRAQREAHRHGGNKTTPGYGGDPFSF